MMTTSSEYIWKDVVGYEGLYIVNRGGIVISLERTYTDSNGITRTNKRSVLTFETTMSDNPRVTLTKDGVSTKHKCFDLVAKAFKDIKI